MKSNRQLDSVLNKQPHTGILFLFFGLASAIVVAVAPALLKIAFYFQLSTIAAQKTISIAILGYAVGPLFAGPIGNSFGRKTAFFIGCLISLIGLLINLLAIYWHHFNLFLWGRFISPFGGAICLTMVYAVLHDFYSETDARKILSFVGASFCLVPGIITLICGVITEYYSWIACFYLLLIYVVLLFVCLYFLPETHAKENRTPPKLKHHFNEYRKEIFNPLFMCFAVLVGFAISLLYVYVAQSPVIALSDLNISAASFGYISLVPYLAAVVALILTGKLSAKYSAENFIRFGLWMGSLASLLMLFLFFTQGANLYSLFILSSLVVAGCMLVNVNAVAIAKRYANNRGTSSALLIFIFMGMSMLFVKLAAWLQIYFHALAYPLVILLLFALAILNVGIGKYLIGRKKA